jgi:hypothetical protein
MRVVKIPAESDPYLADSTSDAYFDLEHMFSDPAATASASTTTSKLKEVALEGRSSQIVDGDPRLWLCSERPDVRDVVDNISQY